MPWSRQHHEPETHRFGVFALLELPALVKNRGAQLNSNGAAVPLANAGAMVFPPD